MHAPRNATVDPALIGGARLAAEQPPAKAARTAAGQPHKASAPVKKVPAGAERA